MESEAAAVYRAIHARLTASSQESWGNRAYAELAPSGAARPYVVAALNGYERQPETALMARITCVADTFAGAVSAAGRIGELFDGADQGTSGALDGGSDWVIVRVMRIAVTTKTHLIDGIPVYESSAVYRFIVESSAMGAHGARLTRVISFGGVTLPDTGLAYRDNFAQLDPLETALPGLDGAFDQGGTGAAGRIEVRLRLVADSAAAMVTARDAIKGLARLGSADVVIEPSPGSAQRSTCARLIRADIQESYADGTHLRAEAAITFAAACPRWFSVTTPSGSGTSHACSGAQTDFTRTTNGNAAVYPLITVTAVSALSLVKVQRISGGVAVDEIAYTDAIGAGGVLAIDARALSVTRSGVDAYTADFSTLDPAWFRLTPGANTIRVIVGAGESAAVSVTWRDSWY